MDPGRDATSSVPQERRSEPRVGRCRLWFAGADVTSPGRGAASSDTLVAVLRVQGGVAVSPVRGCGVTSPDQKVFIYVLQCRSR